MKVYHHNDPDGRCAAAIVYRYAALSDDEEIDFIECNYNDEIDVDAIEKDEKVVIVDFSFEVDVMKKVLKKTDNVVWIDHHKTAIDKYDDSDIDVDTIDGLRDREEPGKSGCELAWEFFVPDEARHGIMQKAQVPEAVLLIGDRDTWKWEFGKRTEYFFFGLQCHDTDPKDSMWDLLMLDENPYMINQLIEEGEIVVKFKDQFTKEYVDEFGFEIEFEGLNCFAAGLYRFGSDVFGDKLQQYDMCISFEFNGENWLVGLYSESVDVAEIAVKNGGGGHSGAAGFVSKSFPFKLEDIKKPS